MHTLTLSDNWQAIVSEDGRRIIFTYHNLHQVTISALAWCFFRPLPSEVGSGLRRGNCTHNVDGWLFTTDIANQTMTLSKGDAAVTMDSEKIEALYRLRDRVLREYRQAKQVAA